MYKLPHLSYIDRYQESYLKIRFISGRLFLSKEMNWCLISLFVQKFLMIPDANIIES